MLSGHSEKMKKYQDIVKVSVFDKILFSRLVFSAILGAELATNSSPTASI